VDSDEEAIALLKEWSPEEEEGEYAYKLRKKLEDVHIWTLIYLAKQHGWTPKIDIDEKRPDLWKGSVTPPVELPTPPEPYVPPPLTLLPSVLQEYVHAAAESLKRDVSFVFLPKLSAIGTAIGIARSIILKPGYIQPPNIWTAIINPTGTLKSVSIEEACFAVAEHERKLDWLNKRSGRDLRRGLGAVGVPEEIATRQKAKAARDTNMHDGRSYTGSFGGQASIQSPWRFGRERRNLRLV